MEYSTQNRFWSSPLQLLQHRGVFLCQECGCPGYGKYDAWLELDEEPKIKRGVGAVFGMSGYFADSLVDANGAAFSNWS